VLEPTLNDLDEGLDAAIFFRISRAAIVNLNSIVELRPMIGGTADVALHTGVILEVSRRRVRDLLDRLGCFRANSRIQQTTSEPISHR